MNEYKVKVKSIREIDYYIEAENSDEALSEAIGLFLDEDNGIDNLEVQIISE